MLRARWWLSATQCGILAVFARSPCWGFICQARVSMMKGSVKWPVRSESWWRRIGEFFGGESARGFERSKPRALPTRVVRRATGISNVRDHDFSGTA